jgi:hypothetical protein
MTTWGQTYWPIYLTVAFVLFGVPELIALASNVYNTLSWYAWNGLNLSVSVNQGMDTVAWWTSLIMWLVFVVVITGHIWWKGI